MKKSILASLAVLGLVSCMQEKLVTVPQSTVITFDNSFVFNATRAAADPSTTTATLSGFNAWGFMDSPSGLVFYAEDVTKLNDQWSYANTQYWTPEHVYYFAALAPMDSENWKLDNTGANTYGAGEVTFTNVDGSEDLLYAATSVATPDYATLTANGMDPVKFQFSHLLSKVKFTFKNGFATDNVSVNVTNVKMAAPKSGTIDLAVENWWDNDDWKLGEESVELSFGDVETLSAGAKKEAAAERLSIPASADYTYTITFNVELMMGENSALKVEKTSTVTGIALDMGKAYNFTAEINPDNLALHAIEFDVTEVKAWDTTIDHNVDTYKDGDTYYVASANGLAQVASEINAGEWKGNIVLLNDIDLADMVMTRSAATSNWTPIGTSQTPFKGIFDGNGYTIKNLVIDGGTQSNIGFFGVTQLGEIKNVNFENAIVSGRLNVGVVAGTPYTSKYNNINVTGHVEVNGMSYVGGVGGKNAYANWTNVTVDVDPTSYVRANSVENGTAYRTYVGGVVGFNGEGTHSFTNITSNIKVEGSTCDVGGLFGIAHYGNQFVNCLCSADVEIFAASEEAEAQEIGGIAGVWNNGGGNVVMTNCQFTGTLKANNDFVIDVTKFGNLVCAAYNTTGTGKLIIDGNVYGANEVTKTPVETSKALIEALGKGENILLSGDVTVNDETDSNGYGSTGINVLNGQTIDGGGNSFGVNKWGTWDSAINITAGTIKNITINSGMRGIFVNHNGNGGKVNLENVTIDGTIYTISCDQGTNNGLEAKNCVFNGWTSYAATIGDVKFVNCSFGEGQGYAFCRPYAPTVFVGCAFEAGFQVDARAAITFENCTLAGKPLTSANLGTLVTSNITNATVK